MKKKTNCRIIACMVLAAILVTANAVPAAVSVDRAVNIARQAKERVDSSGRHLQSVSDHVFKSFAGKTAEIQEILDTRKELEQAGLLDPEDEAGKERLRNLNSRLLLKIDEIKTICNTNLAPLLQAMARFDETVAMAISDSQATRSINTNYTLEFARSRREIKKMFDDTFKTAEQYLAECNNGKNPAACERYHRTKLSLQRIHQMRKMIEARLMVAGNNHRISESIRDQIKQVGMGVSSNLRKLLAKMYVTFSKVSPAAMVMGQEAGGVFDPNTSWNLAEFSNVITVVLDGFTKLDSVLDGMVSDVLTNFGKIAEVRTSGDIVISQGQFSTDEELSYLETLRHDWK